MTTKDEELQNQIEKAGLSLEGADSDAYKRVFDALKKEPDFHLPLNFADKVVQKIEASKESTIDFLWFGVGIFMFTVAAIIAIALTDFKISFGALKFVSGYPGFFIFGIGFILFIQWLDKKLVRSKISF